MNSSNENSIVDSNDEEEWEGREQRALTPVITSIHPHVIEGIWRLLVKATSMNSASCCKLAQFVLRR